MTPKRFTLHIDGKLLGDVDAMASNNGRTISRQIVELVKIGLATDAMRKAREAQILLRQKIEDENVANFAVKHDVSPAPGAPDGKLR